MRMRTSTFEASHSPKGCAATAATGEMPNSMMYPLPYTVHALAVRALRRVPSFLGRKMVSQTQIENIRPLLIAIGMFALVAGLAFGWAAIEAQHAESRTAAATMPN